MKILLLALALASTSASAVSLSEARQAVQADNDLATGYIIGASESLSSLAAYANGCPLRSDQLRSYSTRLVEFVLYKSPVEHQGKELMPYLYYTATKSVCEWRKHNP